MKQNKSKQLIKNNFLNPIFILPILFLSLVSGSINCSLKAPTITFTQTQTASEKQMIGEDKEIEKDGWLISSIKSSSSGSDLWQKDISSSDSNEKDFIIQLKKLAYLTPEISNWKDQGVIGESFDGTLKRNSKIPISPANQESRVKELIEITNESRKKIVEKRLAIEKSKQSELDENELRENLTRIYYQNVESGHYFESKKGNWEIKE
jgi:hypothetical protein